MLETLALLMFVVCMHHPAIGQQQNRLRHESIQKETDKIFPRLVECRLHLQANPELATSEQQTQAYIKKYLSDLGLQVETDVYGYGIVGILKGEKPGKKIAWRADMDALPVNSADQTSPAAQHGCGHDVHMAVALGIAEILAKHKSQLHGTAYFIFQPEEETFKGAKSMIENGLFSKIHPDEIYGMHVTALPVGQIMVKENELFAYQKRIKISFTEKLADNIAQNLSGKIHQGLSRAQSGTQPWELQQILDAEKGLSSPNSMFRDYLIMDNNFEVYEDKNGTVMEAYLYETSASNLPKIIPAVKKMIEENGLKNQLASISFSQENPTVNNDPALTEMANRTLKDIYGENSVTTDYGQVPYFNDDFAYFQQKVPGVYFFLGGSNFDKGLIAMNHSPDFKVDEDCISIGVKRFASLMFERLKE
ncbi:MAG: M20/M25/M40 family metallo-hydrolase [Saprospiraceae bacterium]|nr:M20/M25/M40 family metallo-hydrolase [Saprospiraceae bacterium]